MTTNGRKTKARRRSTTTAIQPTRIKAAAIPAEELGKTFPRIRLPIQPPYPPAEAKSAAEIPKGGGWLYEPKWDGFRCLAFRDGKTVLLQSKAGQPLGRYFPEMVDALGALPAERFVLDSEIVICPSMTFSCAFILLHRASVSFRQKLPRR
jgi:ATP-dependent DNA ligase